MVVANNDVVRADAIGDWNLTTEIVQSYQFQLLSGGPLANADAMDDLHDIVEDLWLIIQGFLNTVLLIRRLKGRLVPLGDLVGEALFVPPLAGTIATDVSSTTVTMPLSLLTLVPRVILRKSFGPALASAITADGLYTAGVTTMLAQMGVFLLTDMVEANGTWRYGYYSPKTLGFVDPVGAVFSSAPGTMARRRIGRGS